MRMQFRAAVLIAFAAISSSAVQAELLMVYGVDDTNQRGRLNAIEMSSDPIVSDISTYSIGLGLRQVVTGVGYLNDGMTFLEECIAGNYRCKDHNRDFATANSLEFEVYNTSGNLCSNLKLIYHRHGRELDNIITYSNEDPTVLTRVVGPGQEARHSEHELALRDISTTDVLTISIEYNGGATGNGHFIDYIAITGDCV